MKKAFLIDINGVLYVGKEALPGAVEAIDFLRENDHPFRLVTNATRSSKDTIHKKLSSMGFKIGAWEIFSAPSATIGYIKAEGRDKIFLLATGDLKNDFVSAGIKLTDEDPDYVVVGDAGDNFSYENMNKAYRLLKQGAELIAMERDRHWMTPEGMSLAAGPFIAGLEYATGKPAKLMGKPSRDFFKIALKDMDARPANTVMIGDDISTDVKGAQEAGIEAWLVKTGKYELEEFRNSKIKPEKIMDSISEIKKEIKK